MSNEKQETIADIAAEMRDAKSVYDRYRCGGADCDAIDTLATISAYADRIEAAWKREKAEVESSALAAGGIEAAAKRECSTQKSENCVGNAAAMREALIETQSAIARCMDILNKIPDTCGYGGLIDDAADELCALQEMHLKSALSAPPHNCDVGTPEEIDARWNAYCTKRIKSENCMSSKNCKGCAWRWAAMPYAPDTKKEDRNDAE